MYDPVFFRIRYTAMHIADKLPLYLFCAEEVERNLARRYSSKGTPFAQLIQIQSGKLHFSLPKLEHSLVPGELLAIPSNTPYAFESYSTGGKYKKIVLELCGRELENIERQFGLDKLPVISTGDPERLPGIASRFIEHHAEDELEFYPELMGNVYSLLYEFSLSSKDTKQTKYPPLLNQACKLLIKTDNSSSIKLYEIAEILHTSVATLNRIFRKHLQISPREYAFRLRMQEAKHLLINSELSIKETACRLGYCNAFHFSNEFRRFHGSPPSKFRIHSEAPVKK